MTPSKISRIVALGSQAQELLRSPASDPERPTLEDEWRLEMFATARQDEGGGRCRGGLSAAKAPLRQHGRQAQVGLQARPHPMASSKDATNLVGKQSPT